MNREKLKEIIKILIFIQDIDKKELASRVSFSYPALNDFLVRHSKMTLEHIDEIFKALDFNFAMAIILSEKNLSRKELIRQILDL